MSDNTMILILVGVFVFGGGLLLMIKSGKSGGDNDEVVTPLKIKAFERLLLYMERMRFAVLVKRVFMPGMTRSDLQFALIQNVQDEFEHNLAQRLYVEEKTWFIVNMAKDEALNVINTAFGENEDADAPMMAQILASKSNLLIDRAIMAIKKEFNTL